MITLRFTYNPTFYNRAIRFFTWYEYTHVELVIKPGVYIGSLPGKGVVCHNKSAVKEKFMTLDVPSEPVVEFMCSQLGKKYDWSGVIGLPFRRRWQSEDKWFCSELIATAINKSVDTFSEESYRIVPRDIALVCKNINDL
jgi:hypothetical protein